MDQTELKTALLCVQVLKVYFQIITQIQEIYTVYLSTLESGAYR